MVQESSSPIERQMKAQWEVMKITLGSEERRLLGQECKCSSIHFAQVYDLNRVASSKTKIFARRASVNQAMDLCY